MKTIVIEDRARLEEIIRACKTCSVGLVDLEGNPYVVPMNFGYRDGVFYLHSGPEGGKLEMLARNSRVCILLVRGDELVYQSARMACSYSMRSESVMCRGNVEFVDDMDEKRRALDIIMQHYTDNECGYSDPAVRHVRVWKVRAEQLSGKAFGLRASEV